MKLIDSTKEKIQGILQEYFDNKQSCYKGDDAIDGILEDAISDINVVLNRLDNELDDLLTDPADLNPSREQMMQDYDAFRQNELAEIAEGR